jgi:uncharacterized protein YukE
MRIATLLLTAGLIGLGAGAASAADQAQPQPGRGGMAACDALGDHPTSDQIKGCVDAAMDVIRAHKAELLKARDEIRTHQGEIEAAVQQIRANESAIRDAAREIQANQAQLREAARQMAEALHGLAPPDDAQDGAKPAQ